MTFLPVTGTESFSGNRRPISCALKSSIVLFFLYKPNMSVTITTRFVGRSHAPRLHAHIKIRPSKKYSNATDAVSCIDVDPLGINVMRNSPTTVKAEAPRTHFQKASGSQSESRYTQKNREPTAIFSFLSMSLLVASRSATSRLTSKIFRRDQVSHDFEELVFGKVAQLFPKLAHRYLRHLRPAPKL